MVSDHWVTLGGEHCLAMQVTKAALSSAALWPDWIAEHLKWWENGVLEGFVAETPHGLRCQELRPGDYVAKNIVTGEVYWQVPEWFAVRHRPVNEDERRQKRVESWRQMSLQISDGR